MWFLSGLVGCLLLVSCNSKKEESLISTSTPAKNGVYQLCENDSENGISMLGTFAIDSEHVVETYYTYNGVSCQASNLLLTFKFISSYVRSGTTYTLTLRSSVVTPNSSSVASAFNSSSYCGITSWSANSSKNILGKICGGETINVNETISGKLYMNGSKLVASNDSGKTTYNSASGWDFSGHAQSISDGNYIFYNGSKAIHLTISSPNYTATYFDVTTLKFFDEYGTFTSANNEVYFSVTSYTPDCGTDEGSTLHNFFSNTTYTMALKEFRGLDYIFDKITDGLGTFKSEYLHHTYTQGCF